MNGSDQTTSTTDLNVRFQARLRTKCWTLVVGGLTGMLGGMGLYTYTRPALLPFGDSLWGLTYIVLAGAYVWILTRTLRQSLKAMIVGLLSGVATVVCAKIAPLWLLSYPAGARELLLPGWIGRAITGSLFVFVPLYLGSYLLMVTISSSLDV